MFVVDVVWLLVNLIEMKDKWDGDRCNWSFPLITGVSNNNYICQHLLKYALRYGVVGRVFPIWVYYTVFDIAKSKFVH